MQWYEEELQKHPDWEKVAEYVDEGITGTLAKKRPQFMQMIEDADKGIFDMIVTREISRFARNYVEAGEYARVLIEKGVAIYFVNEDIYTSDPNSNMMFGIFSIVAEEESRKISDRVKAGQNISRKNGILYGNGNILGYQLKRNINENGKWKSDENTYVIIEDEAETVRMIFDMYLNGMGLQKIQKELTRLGRRNADGEVSWCASKISRILHRKTYAGYLEYNQSRVIDPITKKRKKETDRSTYTSVKGDWEPIISEETWNEAQRILATKTQVIQNRQGMSRVAGKPLTDDLWKKKLVCKYRI